jgi:hypothetical protein
MAAQRILQSVAHHYHCAAQVAQVGPKAVGPKSVPVLTLYFVLANAAATCGQTSARSFLRNLALGCSGLFGFPQAD